MRQRPKGASVWQTVLSRKTRKPRQPKDNVETESRHSNSPSQCHASSQPRQEKEKVCVPGARKIWGTMKSCTVQTVSTTIATLCPNVAGKLQLRRKFKTNDSGHTKRWWFLIREEEDVLVELQQIWDRVSTQTSWRLEECLKYKEATSEPSNIATPRCTPSVQPSPRNLHPTTEKSASSSTTESDPLFLECRSH